MYYFSQFWVSSSVLIRAFTLEMLQYFQYFTGMHLYCLTTLNTYSNLSCSCNNKFDIITLPIHLLYRPTSQESTRFSVPDCTCDLELPWLWSKGKQEEEKGSCRPRLLQDMVPFISRFFIILPNTQEDISSIIRQTAAGCIFLLSFLFYSLKPAVPFRLFCALHCHSTNPNTVSGFVCTLLHALILWINAVPKCSSL